MLPEHFHPPAFGCRDPRGTCSQSLGLSCGLNRTRHFSYCLEGIVRFLWRHRTCPSPNAREPNLLLDSDNFMSSSMSYEGLSKGGTLLTRRHRCSRGLREGEDDEDGSARTRSLSGSGRPAAETSLGSRRGVYRVCHWSCPGSRTNPSPTFVTTDQSTPCCTTCAGNKAGST